MDLMPQHVAAGIGIVQNVPSECLRTGESNIAMQMPEICRQEGFHSAIPTRQERCVILYCRDSYF